MTNTKIIDFIAVSLFEAYIQALKDAKIKYHLNEISYEVKDGVVNIKVPDKISFQEAGRKRKAKRVPIKALIAWGLKYKVSGINKYVYAIQTSIYKKGIRPKPIKFDINQTLLSINLEPYITDLSKTLNR